MRLKLRLLLLLSIAFIQNSYSQSGTLTNSRPGFSYYLYGLIPLHKSKDSIPNLVTVDYQFHAGICQLKNGKTIRGLFSFAPYAKKFDFINGEKLKPEDGIFYKAAENYLPYNIPRDYIRRLALAGKDSCIYTNSDSTIFIYYEKKDMFVRLRSENPVLVYDNVLIVDELCNRRLTFWKETIKSDISGQTYTGMPYYPTNYSYSRVKPIWEGVGVETYRQLRATDEIYYEWKGKLAKIKSWKEITTKFTIDPYILKVADVFKKDRPRDIAFGILFSGAETKINLLPFFEKIEILLADGSKLKGSGYIQPFRYGAFYETGYVHFYDGKTFSLIGPEQLQAVSYRNHSYKPVFDNFDKRWYIGFSFVYGGKTYEVVEGFYCPDNYGFFDQDGEPLYQVYSQKKNGKYILDNDKDLLKAIIRDMNSQAITK